ncbi:MAG: sigma-70 family RNA polymerase sigma factor [Firmicutes bacterium]|nr:sigma-70 family RNA polymerase sigma factor [[Eubacterium] siraeum]MCM1488489.1 sigma-70 family RNA polymerase sigma factor [Bacillota bacterium]
MDITQMFWDKQEAAIKTAEEAYGGYCRKIAMNILDNLEDSQECVNEALYKAWESIPPNKPKNFAGYIGKLTRNIAIDLYRKAQREKRGCGQIPLALEELSECLSTGSDIAESAEYKELTAALNEFLKGLSPTKRKICVLRYSRLEPVSDIAARLGVKESYVLTTLSRTRKKLKIYLGKRGFYNE